VSQSIALPAPALASSATTKARTWHMPRRPLKIAAAGTLLMAGAYGAFSEQMFIDSSDAVVSAYVLDVRAPIEGVIAGLPHASGSAVRVGDVLGGLRNDLVDHQHLDDLRTLESVAASNASADETELHALAIQRDALLARAGAHADAVSIRLAHAVDEAKSTQAALEVQLAQAQRDLQRGTSLHNDGIIAPADYERLVTAETVAKRNAEAQNAAVVSLQAQHVSAMHGLLSEPGTNNDVAYSRQRADELSTKIAEVQRSLAASRAQAAEAHAAVAAESARATQLHGTEVRSPIDGEVWQVNAMDGERIGAGNPLLTLVDCSRQFLLVEVPQDRLPQLAVGSEAHFRLAGETIERVGTVMAASGDPQKEVNHKFAAFPMQDTSQELATVRVSVDAPADGTSPVCAVGRSARVMLPTKPTSLASRMMRRWF
jgi:multidrug resistance efflux pump